MMTPELLAAFLSLEEQTPQTVCAWCPKHGRPPTVLQPGNESLPPSHGICPLCLQSESEGEWA